MGSTGMWERQELGRGSPFPSTLFEAVHFPHPSATSCAREGRASGTHSSPPTEPPLSPPIWMTSPGRQTGAGGEARSVLGSQRSTSSSPNPHLVLVIDGSLLLEGQVQLWGAVGQWGASFQASFRVWWEALGQCCWQVPPNPLHPPGSGSPQARAGRRSHERGRRRRVQVGPE